MSALALMLQAAALPMPPADWTGLPELPLPSARGGEPSAYVRREVAAGRCRAEGNGMAVSVAVLMDADGRVARVVPRAIDCPTVEQFTAGYVSALARRAGRMKPGWYRRTVAYRW